MRAQQVQILSRTPGRVRVHLRGWKGDRPEQLTARLGGVPGVLGVEANPLTGNVLIRFDPRATSEEVVLAALDWSGPEGGPSPRRAEGDRARSRTLLKAGVRGVVGHAFVDALFYTVTF